MISKANSSDFILNNSLEDGLSSEDKERIEKEFIRIVERINKQFVSIYHCEL